MGWKSLDNGKGVAWAWFREHPDEEPPAGLVPLKEVVKDERKK